MEIFENISSYARRPNVLAYMCRLFLLLCQITDWYTWQLRINKVDKVSEQKKTFLRDEAYQKFCLFAKSYI